MRFLPVLLVTFLQAILTLAHEPHQYQSPLNSDQYLKTAANESRLTVNSIPLSTRQHWMREANRALLALSGPCPFAAFGSVIVNHTDQTGELGTLICIGANANSQTGDPTKHGEMAAISNCSKVLTDPEGRYRLSPPEALRALQDLSLYTNAESCPMCTSAIRWANFKEYVYGTSIETLIHKGWGQIHISSAYIFNQSFGLPGETALLGEVLTEETDPLFSWQFDTDVSCPEGCTRSKDAMTCTAN
ncbi:MAG: hypothetical protein M1818_003648 [Claussenomyces sp. TS43310]|nr:MAG: hypothetical protein M1818_003648 [Claussenomyces sp. TS43310]